jgi:hypothetical protein
MGWYKDMYLQEPKRGAGFKAPVPGNIGGVEPDPKTMADPPGPKVIEVESTNEAEKVREQKAKQGDAVSPVATDADMGEDMICMPGRDEETDDMYEGAPLYKCACGGPQVVEEFKGSGDFTDCMTRIVPKAKPDDPEAFCAWYEHEQSGSWPGEKRASKSEGPQIVGE